MEERDPGLEMKEIVEINMNQELKLCKFILLVGMITLVLEWVMVIGKDHKIIRVVGFGLDLDLLVASLLQVDEVQDLGLLLLLLLRP